MVVQDVALFDGGEELGAARRVAGRRPRARMAFSKYMIVVVKGLYVLT